MNLIPAGPLKTINVQRQNILDNEPGVFIIRSEGRRTVFCDRVEIRGESEFLYRPEKGQGARVVLETRAEVAFE